MAYEYPEIFTDVLDEVLVAETITSDFVAEDVEFLTGRTVLVPSIEFGSGFSEYKRFTSDDEDYSYKLEPVELENDVEKQFFIEWRDSVDFPIVKATEVLSEFLRVKGTPEIEANFFAKVLGKTPGKNLIHTDPTKENIKEQIDTGIALLADKGVKAGKLFMDSATKLLFEDALDRKFSNESGVNTQVSDYNKWIVEQAPAEVFGSTRFQFVGFKSAKDVRKRNETFVFAPGDHTKGDGWLIQYHAIYDTVVKKNKAAGLYANTPSA